MTSDGDADAPTPFWARFGFESLQAYLDEQERIRSKYEIAPRRGEIPPTPDALAGGTAGIGPVDPYELRTRQVNLKLRRGEGDNLDRAASLYGIAPTTLARLLVNRGVRAILDRGAED